MPKSKGIRESYRFAREAARIAGNKFYIGQICKKHPELLGQRQVNNCICIECRKEYSRLQSTGFSVELFNLVLKQQENSCAICRDKFDNTDAHADHNHVTKQPRGILCRKCNLMIGFARDNPEILQNAIEYLAKPDLIFGCDK